MPLIGKAIAIVAAKMGGQLMLELPDDLPPDFINDVLQGANSTFDQMPSFAMLVHEKADDLVGVEPRVDFRELAMYRQGQHLAVTYASKNRGMATYSSVYPLLLSAGFPSTQSGETGAGVATLVDLSAAIAAVLLEHCAELEIEPEELNSITQEILKFLADVYEITSGGQSSVAKDWWVHVESWVDNVIAHARNRGSETAAFLYGAAGLPNPGLKKTLEIKPKNYVKTLQERWVDADGIRAELARLRTGLGEDQETSPLDRIDWATTVEHAQYDSDSAVARVALASRADQKLKTEGWAELDEAAFSTPVVDDRAQLIIQRAGVPLPRPFTQSPPVLVATAADVHDEMSRQSIYVGVELVIPLEQDKEVPDSLRTGKGVPRIQVAGVGTCRASFEIKKSEVTAGAITVVGDLTLTPSKAKPNSLAITVKGPEYLRAVEPLILVQVRPDECLFWAREESAGRRRGRALGPWVCKGGANESTVALINKPSRYEMYAAWGSNLELSQTGWSLGGQPMECLAWGGTNGQFASAIEDLTSSVDLKAKSNIWFALDIASTSSRPISPFTAAASGGRPATDKLLEPSVLGQLELEMQHILMELGPGHALGAICATSSKQAEAYSGSIPGCKSAISIQERLDLYPSAPSGDLLNLPAYASLRTAYQDLGVLELVTTIEQRERSGELTVSRIPLDALDKKRVNDVLAAYSLLLQSIARLSVSDQFWGRNPFSAVVFSERSGLQSAAAVLLSPLHPIRLAWAWKVQVGLREAYADGASPAATLSLLDGTNFPAFVAALNVFDQETPFLPVPVDARPRDLYIGWHVSVPILDGSPVIPDWLQGERFPAEGLSTLTPSSISSAVDDFLRVSPEVQTLQIALTSAKQSRRSAAMDEGLIVKLKDLAASSSEISGVAGVTIRDSKHRLGDIPALGRLDEGLLSARPGFNLTWRSAPDGDTSESHITFVEGGAAKAVVIKGGRSQGWLPTLPLRRTPIRKSPGRFTTLDYSLGYRDEADFELSSLLARYEGAMGEAYMVNVMANFAVGKTTPNWLVAGDFGVDPQALALAASSHVGGNYVLWDWRPATTVGASRGEEARVQPYFVLANVPAALSGAIRERLKRLNPAATSVEIDSRARLLVTTLARRAIGLNTLLSIGHHQATGAIGFFFALRSLERWVDEAPPGELRLIVPVDAVDPFLRDTVGYARGASRRRADLLGISAASSGADFSCVNIIPIEIKHYGLVKSEVEAAFPKAGEARLREHAEQLRDYSKQLVELCSNISSAAGSKASILGQRLLAVLDAGLQLNSKSSEHAVGILRCVAEGKAKFHTGMGILIWYQAWARSEQGESASWDEFGGEYDDEGDRRIEVRIDPAAYDAVLWGGGGGDAECHEVVVAALAHSVEDLCCQGTSPSELQTDVEDISKGKPTRLGQSKINQDIDSGADPALNSDPVYVPEEIGPEVEPATPQPPPSSKIDKKTLEQRYDKLISYLSEFHVKVNRPKAESPYKEGPAFVEYAVVPAYGVSVSKIEAQVQNLKLRMRLAADMQLGCSTHNGNVVITVPKADSERYFVDAEEMWNRWQRPSKGFAVPVGEDSSGEIVEIDFSSSNSPHLLMAGVTGSGKSEALLTILHGAAHFYSSEELRLKLIDPKGTELNSLEGLPHTDGPIGTMPEDAIVMLEEGVQEMERRYALFKSAPGNVRSIAEYTASGKILPRWIIVLDEYADLTNDDDERKKVEANLKRISQKARAAGIHLIVSTQKPIVTVVNTVVKGNLPGKIALRVNTLAESRVVLDEGGAEQLVGKGDALIKTGGGKLRVQFARYSLDD
ncbi:DNA translocase FtsK [Stenotrophomonas pennii]|uniref:DNA translocase FtsK n=1 Tax=Stenotrophomonas lacuserhaii TaxID=2760084 RepID=UPI00320AD8BF